MCEPYLYWTCPRLNGVVKGYKDIAQAKQEFGCVSCETGYKGPRKYYFPNQAYTTQQEQRRRMVHIIAAAEDDKKRGCF